MGLIFKQHADAIAAVLSKNTGLIEIDLSKNNIQIEGAIRIAKVLHTGIPCTSLIFLTMGGNNLGDKATDEIATVLSYENLCLIN